MRVHLDIQFGKAAADAEPAAAQKKGLVRMRPARGEGKAAEDGDMNVCVWTRDVFPVREVQPLSFQGIAELEQGGDAADLLQRDHIRVERPNALPDLFHRGRWFGRTLVGGRLQVAFHVVSSDPKGFCLDRVRAEKSDKAYREAKKEPAFRIHQGVIGIRQAGVKG